MNLSTLLCSGPGLRESNPAKPRRAAPSGPAHGGGGGRGGGGQNMQRSYSGSLKRYSRAGGQAQPHLPKSGAQHKAKRGSGVNPDAEFMQTPDSGACG